MHNTSIIRLIINQKEDEREIYHGSLKLGGVLLFYTFNFIIPINELRGDETELPIQNIKSLFQLTVRTNRLTKLEITDEEYLFFFNLIIPFIAKFCFHQDIKECTKLKTNAIEKENKLYSIREPLRIIVFKQQVYRFAIKTSAIPKSLLGKIPCLD